MNKVHKESKQIKDKDDNDSKSNPQQSTKEEIEMLDGITKDDKPWLITMSCAIRTLQ